MDELTIIANKYASDKGTIKPPYGHHGPRLNFTPIYFEHMKNLKNENITILEIGIGSGPSLKMWFEYFPNSEIHAIDIDSQIIHNNDRVTTHIGDQSSRDSLKNIMEKINKQFDIIIDDGSHVVSHQQISLGFLFKYLKNGGQYWIEDLNTSDPSVWLGKTLYGYNMSFNDGESTVNVIENYIKNKKINSKFLTMEENIYLTENIKKCLLYDISVTNELKGYNKLVKFEK